MKNDLENDLEKPGVGPIWESGDPVSVRPCPFSNNFIKIGNGGFCQISVIRENLVAK